MIGFGFASGDAAVWAPWKAGDAANAPLEAWLASDAPKILQAAKPQLKLVRQSGLELNGIAFDTTLAAWIIRPGVKAETLSSQVYDYLGERLVRPRPEPAHPRSRAGESRRSRRGTSCGSPTTCASGSTRGSAGVLSQIEIPLRARARDDGADRHHGQPRLLLKLSNDLGARANELAQEAYSIVGRELNLGSPKQLQEVLFDQLGMPKTRSNKTGYSTDAQSLADLQEQNPHPFLDLLLQHRDATKLKQIIESIDKSIARDDRVHTTYEQAGSTTGRIASNDPNLQNVPIKTEEGRKIRAAFEHRSPATRPCSRPTTRRSRCGSWRTSAATPGSSRRSTRGRTCTGSSGARVFGVDPADVTAPMRVKVKAMSYGLAYGLSALRARASSCASRPARRRTSWPTTSPGSALCATTCAAWSSRPGSTATPRPSSAGAARSPT